MISGTLTLFSWSLKSDARALWPHLVRAGFAVFMLLSVSAAFVEVFGASGPGLLYFQSICFLNVLLISVSGISYFVSAVTEEKDAGTLALLRLAGVTPLAIILGKSTSRLISSLMLLLIQIPFTFLSITLGGVTWQQIIAAYLALAAWMAFVCNIALFSSVRCQTSGRAAGMAGAVLVIFFSIKPVVTNGLLAIPVGWLPAAAVTSLSTLADWQSAASITNRLAEILTVSTASPVMLGTQFWWNMIGASVLFVVSTIAFDRWSAPQDSAAETESAIIRRLTVGRCWRFPMLWKDFQFFTGGYSFFAVKLIAYAALVAALCYLQKLMNPWGDWRLQGDSAWTAFLILLGIMNVEVLLYSSGTLFSELRQSTLSSLAMIPVSTNCLLLQKGAACIIALAPVLLLTIIVVLMDPQGILHRCSATVGVTYLTVLLLSSHLTVLLSLYTRWAALPLAILLTAACFMCCPMVFLLTFSLTEIVARSQNLQASMLLGSVLNLFWVWLFLLLPMELEIVNRWNRLSEK